MFRTERTFEEAARPFPHACGDVPGIAPKFRHCGGFSPRLWGCSVHDGDGARDLALFPTPVGMFRRASPSLNARSSFPHACGDVPASRAPGPPGSRFSPRLWGCSVQRVEEARADFLFPTPVGMFRCLARSLTLPVPFPHACGDVPAGPENRPRMQAFSPRLWGCSESLRFINPENCLFPTPVGMFRRPARPSRPPAAFPHACGDVPEETCQPRAHAIFSPRLWGCSGVRCATENLRRLFPTPVGMFRSRPRDSERCFPFPHACGDVPATMASASASVSFSPRLWGCSGKTCQPRAHAILFPTPVGMFRSRWPAWRCRRTFPHACGDVPEKHANLGHTQSFSPRLWGCSGRRAARPRRRRLFPTPVGMFRQIRRYTVKRSTFPHACGDVPRLRRRYGVQFAFSPRLWGCSDAERRDCHGCVLFPTPVGMFR